MQYTHTLSNTYNDSLNKGWDFYVINYVDLSFVERLSSSQRFKMYYNYGKPIIRNLCVTISECPLLEVLLYHICSTASLLVSTKQLQVCNVHDISTKAEHYVCLLLHTLSFCNQLMLEFRQLSKK